MAIGASLLLSICLLLWVLLPSFFITAAIFFFWFLARRALLSWVKRWVPLVAFYLYRKGFKQEASERLKKYKRINQLWKQKTGSLLVGPFPTSHSVCSLRPGDFALQCRVTG
jgi:hypothetical protein